jgi:hypothetical protein
VVLHLHYPHCAYLPLDHCSPLEFNHGVHLLLHVYLDQALVRVEWCHLGKDLEVDLLDLVALHHQQPFFPMHHMEIPQHLQDQDQLAIFESH